MQNLYAKPVLKIRAVGQMITASVWLITVRNEVAKVMFLHLSVCPQGRDLPQCMLGYPPEEQAPPRDQDPPQQTAKVTDGTHSTGMHSCFKFFSTMYVYMGNNMKIQYLILKIQNLDLSGLCIYLSAFALSENDSTFM